MNYLSFSAIPALPRSLISSASKLPSVTAFLRLGFMMRLLLFNLAFKNLFFAIFFINFQTPRFHGSRSSNPHMKYSELVGNDRMNWRIAFITVFFIR